MRQSMFYLMYVKCQQIRLTEHAHDDSNCAGPLVLLPILLNKVGPDAGADHDGCCCVAEK